MATLSGGLVTGRAEINTRWPNRDKRSDGWISDAAHAAHGYPTTKHSPNLRDYVHAIDVDTDGVDMNRIKGRFAAMPQAHLWIHNRQIAFRHEGWRPRKYTGPDPHTGHGHIEDEDTPAAEHDLRTWNIGTATPASAPAKGTAGRMVKLPVVRRNPGVSTAAGRQAQLALRKLGADLGTSGVDGRVGDATVAAIRTFQRGHQLAADGAIGATTWCALLQALLNRFGYGLKTDGRYGPATTAAVVQFQRASGLAADGVAGPKTWASLLTR